MKINDLIILAYKSNKGVKKKYIFVVIMLVFLLLIMLPFSFYKTYDITVSQLLDKENDFRKIFVNGNDSYQKLNSIKEILPYDKIVKIKDNYVFNSGLNAYFDKENLGASAITAFPNIEYFTPPVIAGNAIHNSYDMICPSLMSNDKDIAVIDEKLNILDDMTSHIGEDYTISFMKIIFNKTTNKEEVEWHDKKFKLVGVYDASLTTSYGQCYFREDTLDAIHLETLRYDYEKYEKVTTIYIKKQKDVKEITDILDNYKITYQVPYLELDFLNTILIISYIFIVILSILSIPMLYLYLNIYIKERDKELKLYKYLGYEKNLVTKIVLTSIILLLIKIFLISILLLLSIKYILTIILTKYVVFSVLKIYLSYEVMFIFFLLLIVFSYIVVKRNTKRLYEDI